ncbi:hypothetical protein ABIC50_005194 [Burkholderia sp. 567]
MCSLSADQSVIRTLGLTYSRQGADQGKGDDFIGWGRLDPLAYLKDVLTRLPTHKASDIDALPPHRWQPLSTAA